MRMKGTSFHASLGRTGMKKRASFKILVRHIRTTVRKWELWFKHVRIFLILKPTNNRENLTSDFSWNV